MTTAHGGSTMRIRTIVTLLVGAAAGYGAAYLGDPDHGRERRSEAGTWAAKQAVVQAKRQSSKAVTAAGSWSANARAGFDEGRQH